MLKSIFITLVCMSVVCFIIIASAKYTVVAILSVLSTSYSKSFNSLKSRIRKLAYREINLRNIF